MKKVKEWQTEDCGVEHEQCFQGRGVSFTPWEFCWVGVGDDAFEAMEDALDQAAGSGWDVDKIPNDMSKEVLTPATNNEIHHYAALYVK